MNPTNQIALIGLAMLLASSPVLASKSPTSKQLLQPPSASQQVPRGESIKLTNIDDNTNNDETTRSHRVQRSEQAARSMRRTTDQPHHFDYTPSELDMSEEAGSTDESEPELAELPAAPTPNLRPSRQSVSNSPRPKIRPASKPALQMVPMQQAVQTSLASSGSSTPSTFNVDMGSDQMLIKQHRESSPPTRSSLAVGVDAVNTELPATESIHHELLSHSVGLSTANERRQDLLYPSSPVSNMQFEESSNHGYFGSSGQPGLLADASDLNVGQPSICYTPISLITVVLVTMFITIVVCFAAHMLMKYLGRHQFDLIENSRQYETKHPNDGYLGQQKSSKSYQRGQANLAPPEAQLEPSSLTNPGTKYSIGSPEVCGQAYGPASAVCQRSTHGAFDNPYFRDEHPDELDRCDLERGSGALPTNFEHLYSKPAVRNFSSQQQSDQFGAQQPVDPGQHHQLDFIENRLANLHSRQLTSSVNELSVGQGDEYHSGIVDLTSEAQRAKVIADPQEGDLIAVDISGHDFIGLGFDVCGNQVDGIFIKSVLARGPARESGCIQAGDRIKCLNISFENITLRDAIEILNCGAPYRLRLLLEKCAYPALLEEDLKASQKSSSATNTKTYIKRVANQLLSLGSGKTPPSFSDNPPPPNTTGRHDRVGMASRKIEDDNDDIGRLTAERQAVSNSEISVQTERHLSNQMGTHLADPSFNKCESL